MWKQILEEWPPWLSFTLFPTVLSKGCDPFLEKCNLSFFGYLKFISEKTFQNAIEKLKIQGRETKFAFPFPLYTRETQISFLVPVKILSENLKILKMRKMIYEFWFCEKNIENLVIFISQFNLVWTSLHLVSNNQFLSLFSKLITKVGGILPKKNVRLYKKNCKSFGIFWQNPWKMLKIYTLIEGP